jgi:uncharacterized protein YjbI with pentapeptide repeats
MSKEKAKTCDRKMRSGKICNKPLHDDKHCIFHSEDIEGKKGQFEDFFWKEFERQTEQHERYDFTGFVFPGDISFEYLEFNKVYTNFEKAKFHGKADFRRAIFFGDAEFHKAKFFGAVDFGGARFIKDLDFIKVIFKDFNKCNMTKTFFNNVFGLLEYLVENRKNIKHPRGIKYLHDDCVPILGEATVSRIPFLSREIKDDVYLMSFKEKHPRLHCLCWLFADCGRSFLRWALWSDQRLL